MRLTLALFFSALVHLALFAGLFADLYSSAGSEKVRVEIQYLKPAGRPAADHLVQAQKSAAAHTTTEPLPAPAEEETSTVLGSDIGVQASYPRLSRVMGEKGTVLIAVVDNAAQVSESSGFTRLDTAALTATQEALKSGRFSEHKKLKIRFIFKLLEAKNEGR